MDFPLTKLCKGIYVNAYPTNGWAFVASWPTLATWKGDDAEAPNKGGAEKFRLQRNLKIQIKTYGMPMPALKSTDFFFEQYDGLEQN